MEVWVIAILVFLLGLQQAFYMWQTHKLLNKLMSRNYVEYSQVARAPQPQVAGFNIQLPDAEEQLENDRVKQLNHMMGMSPL